MVFYHGSKAILASPRPFGSNANNNYGPAFYATDSLEEAKSWACKDDEVGLVNSYRIKDSDYASLNVLDLTDKERFSVLNWIAILMHFRILGESFRQRYAEGLQWLEDRYYLDVTAYDLVIGYRADDAYFRFPREFISSNLAFEDLERTYLLGNLGLQYVFVSPRAVSLLKFKGTIYCEDRFLREYHRRVQSATEAFKEIFSLPHTSKKTYLVDLVRRDSDD